MNLKKTIFSRPLKVSSDSASLIFCGRLFQISDATTEKTTTNKAMALNNKSIKTSFLSNYRLYIFAILFLVSVKRLAIFR